MKIENRKSKIETRSSSLEAEAEWSVSAVVNRRKEVKIDLARIRRFLRRLLTELGLAGRGVNVGFVDDIEIARMNAAFRGAAKPTDVLSFSAQEGAGLGARTPRPRQEGLRLQILDLGGFLGDIVISAETARRNAQVEGHSTENEIRWLILHGVLHLCGFDHERDGGEMTALELKLRERLEI